MKVTCIGRTVINADLMEDLTDGKWTPEEFYDDGSALAEFAGRGCYESWTRPNPETASNEGYLRNIIAHRHFSVMEHGTVTFHIDGVSRSLTHELVRHRHHSYSQLSQRFVIFDNGHENARRPFITPPLYEGEMGMPIPSETEKILTMVWDAAAGAYDRLVAIHMPALLQSGVDMVKARKMAREAARCVLPNMTPTSLVMSGNHRAWRELLEKRGTLDADAEICRLAVVLYYQLVEREPNLYQDFRVETIKGREVLVRG